MKDRLENIQALRGAAALLVLFAHLKGAQDIYSSLRFLPGPVSMGVIGVDLFFLISGYVMVHVTAERPRGGAESARFAYQRAARIYPLYWAATIGVLILYAGKKVLFGEDTEIANWLSSFLLLPHADYPIVTVGWTLVHEMYFYLVFALIMLVPRAAMLWLLPAWGALVIAGEALGWRAAGPWASLAFSALTLEFLAGCAIALLVRRGVIAFGRAALIAGALWLAILCWPFYDAIWPDGLVNHALRAALFAPPCALILYGAVAMERARASLAPLWLRRAGDASYAIYLVHVPALLVTGTLARALLGDGVGAGLAVLIVGCAAAIAAGFIAHYWAEKPMLAASRRLGSLLFSRALAPHAVARAP